MSVFLQILHQYSVSLNITTLYLLSSNIIYFGQKLPIMVQIFKYLMSILNWKVNSCSNFESFFIVMTHNSHVNFKLIQFLLCTKHPNKSPNFQTFKCALVKICQIPHFLERQVSFPTNFELILSVSKHNSSLLAKFKHQTLWSKATH